MTQPRPVTSGAPEANHGASFLRLIHPKKRFRDIHHAAIRAILGGAILLLAGVIAPPALRAQGTPDETSVPEPEAFFIRGSSSVEPERGAYPANVAFEFVARVHWSGKLADVKVLTPDSPELENLDQLSAAVGYQTHPESQDASAEFRFTLRPQAQGPASIGRVLVEYRLGGEQGTLSSLTIEGQDLQIGPPRRDWARIGMVAAMGFGAILVIGYLIRTGLRAASKPPPPPAPPSPFEELRGKIEELDRHEIEGDFTAFHGEVRDILMRALSEVGDFGSRASTAMEFRQWFEALDEDDRQPYEGLCELLEQSERVRFAGWRPSAEDNRAAKKKLETLIDKLERRALWPEDDEDA
ncbi:MAG: hypothetical protein IID54_05100 [Proteobacteria bacterium]|nr:hypothetical protein [Pseudomonadota bacterium]